MLKFFVVLSPIVALAAAGSSGDVDDQLLQRVAQILSENDGGSGGVGGGGSGGVVDSELLSRVSQIIAQNEGSSGGGGSSGYSAPSSSYGAPSSRLGGSGRSGGLQIGRPERAQSVAEFSESSGGGSRSGGGGGGYSSGGY